MRTILVSLLVALALPAAVAAGGGWATAGLAPPPEGIEAGEIWHAEITLRQHGRTPLDGVRPSIALFGPDGPAGTFPARPAGKPGAYVAEVVFPGPGAYRYQVDDGFSQIHTFSPVEVAPVGGGAEGLPGWTAVPIAAAAAALAGAALLLLLRRRARVPAPAAALD